MLSKLRFFRTQTLADLARVRELIQPSHWADKLRAHPDHFHPLSGGTLNIAFKGLSDDGKLRCFKTHLTQSGRLALRREAAILQGLYGERLNLDFVSSDETDWLAMNLLVPLEPEQIRTVNPDWIATLTKTATSLKGLPIIGDCFADVVTESKISLQVLESTGEIKSGTASCLLNALERLSDDTSGLDQQLCHGDLGPKNIMRDEKSMILLDWEDTLQAFPGYDWIYWLSFFANRQLLSREALLRSGLPQHVCRAVLIAIILIKSELSLRSGAAVGNLVAVEDRLGEALQL